jgi:hypothetical protein
MGVSMAKHPVMGDTQTTFKLNLGRVGFYLGCILLAAVVYGIEVHIQNTASGVLGSMPDLPDPQSRASEAIQTQQPSSTDQRNEDKQGAFMAMNQLITTLGTTLMGALGFLLANRKSASKPLEMWAAFASFVCVGLSLYFGYRGYIDLIHLLNVPNFDLTGGLISSDRDLQFGFFVLGVFFFADFAFYQLNSEGSKNVTVP